VRVSENRLMGRICRLKREEVTKGWRPITWSGVWQSWDVADEFDEIEKVEIYVMCIVGGEHEGRISVLVREPGCVPAYICEGNI
jgi:hypothetical protein